MPSDGPTARRASGSARPICTAENTATGPATSACTTMHSNFAAARMSTRSQTFLQKHGVTIVDPAGEYYDDYYAVFFLDPDGLKLEGMKYGERHARAARKRAETRSKKMARKRAKRG